MPNTPVIKIVKTEPASPSKERATPRQKPKGSRVNISSFFIGMSTEVSPAPKGVKTQMKKGPVASADLGTKPSDQKTARIEKMEEIPTQEIKEAFPQTVESIPAGENLKAYDAEPMELESEL